MRFSQPNMGRNRRGFSFGPGVLPPFIKAMLIINAAMFLLQLASNDLSMLLGLTPARFFSEFPNLFHQVFTYMFLHGGFWHIFFNMFVLWMFGSEIEVTWGSKRFGKFYILAGLSGAVFTLIFQSNQQVPMIGASAAIYGVLAAYWIMFPDRKLYIYFLFPVKVKWAIPGMMLLGLLFGGRNVAHLAHLGGAAFGLIYMKLDWRILNVTGWFKQMKYRRQNTKLNKNRQKAEDVMKRVDDILDKINEVGFENLSKAEKEFLNEASSQLSKKKTND